MRGWIGAAVVAAALTATIGSAEAAPLDGDLIGSPSSRTTSYDDTLLDIARQHRLGVIELMAANPGVDPWLPGAGVAVTLPTQHVLPDAPRRGIVINNAELRLYDYADPQNPQSFPIGVGRDGYLTPIGSTSIARKKERPSWYLTESEIRDHPELPRVIPPGPDNPLGEYALYLGWPSYLVHGTDNPWSVGRRASRGCIRLYPEDIEFLFKKTPIGTSVTVVDQPVKLGRSRSGDLYLEVHPSSKQVDAIEEASRAPGPPEPLPLAEWADRVLLAAGPDATSIDWPVVEAALTERTGVAMRIAVASGPRGSLATRAAQPAAPASAPPPAAPTQAKASPAPPAAVKSAAAPTNPLAPRGPKLASASGPEPVSSGALAPIPPRPSSR